MEIPKYIIFPGKEKESLRKRYGETLVKIGEKDVKVVVLDADLSSSTQTIIFARQFPERHFDMGIAEADMIGTAAGFAATGLKPFASSFAMFAIGRAYDQIRNAIAYADLPVKIVATHAGITVGEDGGSHQMIEDIAMMRVLPNMNVVVPADAEETEQVIKFAHNFNHPIYVRLSREKFPVIYNKNYTYIFGKWNTVIKGDDKIVIIACGLMVSVSMDVADELRKNNINATVVNASTIKPLDEKFLKDIIKNVKLIITIEEALIAGGLGSLVSEFVTSHRPVYVLRIGIDDRFGQSGKLDDLLNEYEFKSSQILKKIQKKLSDIKYKNS